MIFREKRIGFTSSKLKNGQNYSKIRFFSGTFWKLPMTISWELNMLENSNLCQNMYFWILYYNPLITPFRPKVDLGPIGNEL